MAFLDGCEVAKILNAGVTMCEQRGAKRIDLREPCRVTLLVSRRAEENVLIRVQIDGELQVLDAERRRADRNAAEERVAVEIVLLVGEYRRPDVAERTMLDRKSVV